MSLMKISGLLWHSVCSHLCGLMRNEQSDQQKIELKEFYEHFQVLLEKASENIANEEGLTVGPIKVTVAIDADDNEGRSHRYLIEINKKTGLIIFKEDDCIIAEIPISTLEPEYLEETSISSTEGIADIQ